jgi:hypothetical protein
MDGPIRRPKNAATSNIHILTTNEVLMFGHEHSKSHAFLGFIRQTNESP